MKSSLARELREHPTANANKAPVSNYWLSIFVAFLLCFAGTGVSIAEKLPDNASAVLENILTQDEFQPRRIEPSWWERTQEAVFFLLLEEVRKIWINLKHVLSSLDIGSISIPGAETLGELFRLLGSLVMDCLMFIGKVWQAAAWLIAAALGAAVVYGILRVVHKLSPELRSIYGGVKIDLSKGVEQNDISYHTFLQQGRYREALAAFRLQLRKELGEQELFSSATTDRELCRELMKQGESVDIFQAVSQLFESVMYGGKEIRIKELLYLVERHGAYVAEGAV